MKFRIGDRVQKISGSAWKGVVVGTYSTALTREGYCVESDAEYGSVQIYPAAALEAAHVNPQAVDKWRWLREFDVDWDEFGWPLCRLIREEAWTLAWEQAAALFKSDFCDDSCEDEDDISVQSITDLLVLSNVPGTAPIRRARRKALHWYIAAREGEFSEDVMAEMLYNLLKSAIAEEKARLGFDVNLKKHNKHRKREW